MRKIPGFDQAPYIGALMRIGLETARNRILKALAAAGHDSLNLSYVGLFQYPPLDGQRPSDIAKRLSMTKQALNHLLGQMEKLGYVERRSEAASRLATIHYTERGWEVLEIILATMQRLEADWRAKIGDERFAEFKSTMKELISD